MTLSKNSEIDSLEVPEESQKNLDKAAELKTRRWKERQENAFDLGWLAAKHKKVVTDNPYASHELETLEIHEPTEAELLAQEWVAGYNTFKGNIK